MDRPFHCFNHNKNENQLVLIVYWHSLIHVGRGLNFASLLSIAKNNNGKLPYGLSCALKL